MHQEGRQSMPGVLRILNNHALSLATAWYMVLKLMGSGLLPGPQ